MKSLWTIKIIQTLKVNKINTIGHHSTNLPGRVGGRQSFPLRFRYLFSLNVLGIIRILDDNQCISKTKHGQFNVPHSIGCNFTNEMLHNYILFVDI